MTEQTQPAPQPPIMIRGEQCQLQIIPTAEGNLPVLVIVSGGGLVSTNLGMTPELIDALLTALTDARQGMAGGGLVVPTAEQAAQVNGRRR